jgi:hypothetical protein
MERTTHAPDPVAILLDAPPGTALLNLWDDDGEEKTVLMVHETPEHVSELPKEVPMSVRSAILKRSGVDVLVLLVQAGGGIYETWWNWHNPLHRRALLNLCRQDELIVPFFADAREPVRTIALESPVKEGMNAACEHLEATTEWSMEQFDAARDEIYSELPTVEGLWAHCTENPEPDDQTRYQNGEAIACESCGTSLTVRYLDPAEGRIMIGSPDAFRGVALRCHACGFVTCIDCAMKPFAGEVQACPACHEKLGPILPEPGELVRPSEPSEAGPSLDELVSDPRLTPGARALLLLRVCTLAQLVRPDLVERYLGDLKKAARDLPEASRESFDGLQQTLEPPPPASLEGFAREIAEAVDAANHAQGHDAKVAAIRECEQRISRRRWPSGKKAAWETLVRSWVEVERAEGLKRLQHLPRVVRTNVLVRENGRTPLGALEWQAVHEKDSRAACDAVKVLLDQEDDPHLELPEGLARTVGMNDLTLMFSGAADDPTSESVRDQARARWLKLIKAVAAASPDVAPPLFDQWFRNAVHSRVYAERWLSRFFELLQVLTVWASYPALEPRLDAFLRSPNVPEAYRDALRAHAAGLKAESPDDADAAWASVEPELTDKVAAEQWFLVTLLRSGLPEHALELARRSANADQLVPCLCRIWLYQDADSARPAIAAEELGGDSIAAFLLRDREGRVEFLRKCTGYGQSELPETMWRPPSALDLLREMDHVGTGGTSTTGGVTGSWYAKTVPAEDQFAVFVRINGGGQHLHESFDPILLETLVAWDESHPDEVPRVMGRAWETMQRPITEYIRLDLLRDNIFERCRAVLAARPETMQRFVDWIRAELVEQPVQEVVGDTTYTFQLGEHAPFVFALQGAQNVARASARRCDEVLTNAVASYPASDELLAAAARLYAADKGMAALDPPATLNSPMQLEAWQLGVLDAGLNDVIAALVAGPEAATPSA